MGESRWPTTVTTGWIASSIVWASKPEIREAWIAAPRATSSEVLYVVGRMIVGEGNAVCRTDASFGRDAVPPTSNTYN